jgi:hypothetical protein
MVTPEAQKAPARLTEQLQVAFAAAIGLTTGVIFWELFFYTRAGR